MTALTILAFLQVGAKGLEEVRFGAITDVHNGPGDNEPAKGLWTFDMRWFSNAPTRMAAFAVAMESRGDIDFCIDLGDIVNSASYDDNNELTEITDALENNWSGQMHYLIGNHEYDIWSNNWTGYEAEILQYPPDMNDYWSVGKLAGYPITTSYSFVKKGVHFVVLGCMTGSACETQRAWLNNNLAATSLPIVLFSHHHLHNGAASPPARRGDWREIQAILESYNVQAVLQGHLHPIPEVTDSLYIKSGIPYFNLRGNLLGPPDGSTPVPSDAAYYVFGIQPNAVQGKGRLAALIIVKGYAKGQSISGYVYGNSWITWPIVGDIDADGDVDETDLAEFTSAWLTELGGA